MQLYLADFAGYDELWPLGNSSQSIRGRCTFHQVESKGPIQQSYKGRLPVMGGQFKVCRTFWSIGDRMAR
jgi:hypothetical protein